VVAANDTVALGFLLSSGEAGDAPQGRALLEKMGPQDEVIALLMDRAYEGDETRALAISLGYNPVVPPKSNRREPWEYDEELYKKRNEVERFFRRYDRYRRIFTRYDKLDVMFLAHFTFALIVDALIK
jgi:transposase